MQARVVWVLIILGTQVVKKKQPLWSVFPQYLSISYDDDKYNNTVHRTIKLKPIDVTSYYYAEYNEDSNQKDRKFKVGDRVRISKYKIIFAEGYTQN